MREGGSFLLPGVRIEELSRGHARLLLEADCPFLEGHFPGAPLLPAVAQLALAVELVRRDGERRGLVGVERMKLLRPLRPGCRLELRVAVEGSRAGWKIFEEGELAASGDLRLG